MAKPWHDKTAGPRPWTGLPPGQDAFCLLVDTVRDYAIFLLDTGGLIQSWNIGAQLITGYKPDEIIGRHFSLLYTPPEIETGWPQRELTRAAEADRVEDEGWRVRKGGERFWANVVTTAMRGPDGSLYGYSKIIRDLTQHRHQEELLKRTVERTRQLWTQSVKDPLTGAFNRRYMLDQLGGAIERAGWVTASLVMLDIDYFKSVNDLFGHVAGDTVLVGVAATARRLSRDSDLVFRLGGDEFALYLPGVMRAGAIAIAERLRLAIAHSGLIKDHPVSVTLGVAEIEPGDDAGSWIARADAALYEAKRAGRNRVL